MNTFQDLNTFGQTQLDVTDQRPSGIILDRPFPQQPFDQVLDITSTTVTPSPGIEILDIINYSTANVRYRVTVRTGSSPLLTGSTISWASLPAHVTLTTVGDQYTLSGLKTRSDWQAVRNFTWTLPANYATRPLWFLEVAILYYDSATSSERVVDWEVYDEDHYYISQMSSAFTSTGTVVRIKQSAVTINSAMTFALTILKIKSFSANISSAFSMTPIPTETMMFVNATVTANVIKRKGTLLTPLQTTSSLTASLDRITSNLRIPRTYEPNADRALFVAGSPVIYNPNPGPSDTYTIELTAQAQTTWPVIDTSNWFNSLNQPAEFAPNSTTTPSTTYSYTGTLAQVNSHFASIRYLPPFMGQEFADQGFSFPNQYVTYTQKKNGVTQFTTTLTLTPFGDGEYQDAQMYTWTSGGATFTPVNHQLKYADMSWLIVGGGGGGGVGGGGGGGVARRFYLQPERLVYTIDVGTGGAVGADGTASYYAKGASYPGTPQLFAYGGQFGKSSVNNTSGGTSGFTNSGNSSKSGGAGVGTNGGGGGSQAQVGESATSQTGGNGGSPTFWFGDYYAPGGGGAGGGATPTGFYGRGGQGHQIEANRQDGNGGIVKLYVKKRKQDPTNDQ